MSKEVSSTSDWLSLATSKPITSLPPPSPQSADEVSQCQDALASLAESHPEHHIPLLRLAASLPPFSSWSSIALKWASAETPEQSLVTYCSSALSASVFDSQEWLASLSRGVIPESFRLIFQKWAKVDHHTFFTACELALHTPEARLSTSQLILDVLMAESYEPGNTASTTIMAQMASHSIMSTLLRSLLFDTGNQIFPISLRCFLAVLPYAPSAFCSHVPIIMIVLGRAAYWRDRPFVDHGSMRRDGVTRTPLPNPSYQWGVATSALEESTILPTSLQPVNITRVLFVAIYNAWPSNVLAFIRDPVAYINGKGIEPVYDVPWEETWESGVLASRVAPLLRNFHLHPSLVLFTSSSELADEKRWDKIDPPEFIARSHMLAHSELLSADKYDLLDGLPQDSVPPVEEHPETNPERLYTPDGRPSVSQLQREVQLLRLEARFTDRIRKQYLFHIGRLHKHTLRFNSDEAEIHSFVNRLKEQSKSIEKLNAELAQQRIDATQAQNKHVKWQEQLRERLAMIREERKVWQNEAAQIRGELSEALATVQRQKEEIATINNERFKLQGQLTEISPKVRHIEDYEIRMKQLVHSQRLWDDDVRRCKEAAEEVELWRGRCYKLEMLLRSSASQRDDLKKQVLLAKQELADLKPSFRSTRPPSPRQLPDMDFYITIADNAKKRAETLEKENLELHVELEKLRSSVEPELREENDRSFIWGDQ